VKSAAGNALPVITSKISGNWIIFFYEEFESLVFEAGYLNKEIALLVSFVEAHSGIKGFRREVVINNFPLLCAVRPESMSIYIGTRRVSRELSLLKFHESKPSALSQELDKQLFKLKSHVEMISALNVKDFPSEIEWVTFKENLPTYWNEANWKDVNAEAALILKKLVNKVSDYHPSFFERISDYGLSLTAQYDLIRIHLLKFLALLPSLDHDKAGTEVKRNLLESLRRLKNDSDRLCLGEIKGSKPLPSYLLVIFSFVAFFANVLPAKALVLVVRSLVRKMARRFIAGESIATSHETLAALRRSKRDATLDQLGELVVSTKEAEEYFEKVLQLIHGMKQHIPKGQKNSAGILSAHVSIKVSALSHDFRPQAFDATYAKVAPRLRRILQEAAREEVFINIDAEHHHYRDLVLKIFSKVLLETSELKEYDQTGIVVQAYLRDGARHLEEVIELARKRNIRMPIRLVKGAYWDAETIEAEAHQFTPPQFLNKEETDIHFRQLAHMALANCTFIHLAIGSHNLQDHAFVEALRSLRFKEAPVIEHQCLHMTYEALSHGLAKMGWPTRNYMPIGNLLVGMAYLVRRIMENSSQVGVLSIMRSHQKAAGLISPIEVHQKKKRSSALKQDSFISELKDDFSPVRPLRLFLQDELQGLVESLQQFETNISSRQDEWKQSTEQKVSCSSAPQLILGTYQENKPDEALSFVMKAEESLRLSWWGKQTMCLQRVAIMLKVADIMLLRRNELAALIIYEAGKTMSEALGDVDEAIDFINFYARQEMLLQSGKLKLTNRGVIAVIAPWNFPLAIPCGMAVAPLVAGNAVILKPAEQTPLIGRELYQLLITAGVPADVFYLVQGDGEQVGAPLVKHPRVAGIVFTGSKGVGQWIYQQAAPNLLGHYHHQFPMQKKVITEMGGKNAVIVTNNCELDETISGILYGAFGHAGQKCSAASRVIVHREVKASFLLRLKEAVQDLKVGSALDPSTTINPLICEFDQKRVRKAVEEAKEEVIRHNGKIIIDRSFEKLPGFCVGPVVLELPIHQARKQESWAQREIFGPVIHVMEFESLIEAVELFNDTAYALTGGIYSQSQDDIDFLLKFLRAGNLYVNRPNTGARVAIEPFGGFKLSGTGPKAGGEDYLKQFHFPLYRAEHSPAPAKLTSSSGYQLNVPRPSFISIGARLKRFEVFVEKFFLQLDSFAGDFDDSEKAAIREQAKWIIGELPRFLGGKFSNYVIPGQQSYNDYSIVKEAGLFCMVAPQLSARAVHYLFASLSMGCGLSVICLSESSYATWKAIVDIAYKAGFSKATLDLAMVADNDLKHLLQRPEYSFIYADYLSEFHRSFYAEIFAGESLQTNMKLLLSECDGYDIKAPFEVQKLFVWPRSIAINTMRHGAPLELGV
jgi:RHH-type transcriptional regulator, proline utilization regulon repressor / proline dehydrogenase / delta 1-pyrroline-5-carboxylate dehydrogenase